MSYFVLDENNNRVEAFSKEEVLSVLAQAIAEGSLENITADAAFISKLKCCVGGETFKIAFVTEAKYNELKAAGMLTTNTYYYITDDNSYNDILDFINNENLFDEGILERLNGIDNLIVLCRRKDEARQSINNSGTDNYILYDGTYYERSIPLLSGKTYEDIIGVSLELVVRMNYETYYFDISTLWANFNNCKSRFSEIYRDSETNNSIYCLTGSIGVNSNNNLYLKDLYLSHIDNNGVEDFTVFSVAAATINFYYK